MNGRNFEPLARLIATMQTRRAALGTFLGAMLGQVSAPVGATRKGEGKGTPGDRQRGRTNRTRGDKRGAGNGRGKRKPNPRTPPRDPAVAVEAASCANPGPSANLNGCDFRRRDFTAADLSSSSMRGTRFQGANLCGADLSSSQLKHADFRGLSAAQPTNLFRADLHSSGCAGVRFNANTRFCGTLMCNGTVRNGHCPPGIAPEEVCCTDVQCGSGAVCCANACINVQAAVADAEPGATITLCAGVFPTNVTIAKNLTLVGAGQGDDPATDTILDGGDAGRVLQITAGVTVTVRHLRIRNGRGFGVSGGGIQNSGALTLEGISVVDNTATQGGGIDNQASLTLVNSSVSGNSAVGGSNASGGGIRNGGSGPFVGGLILKNSDVTDNHAASQGGGIFSTGTVTLEASRVADNTSGGAGGGIVNGLGTTTLRDGSSVTGNTALTGGGILNSLGTTILEADSSVTGNSAGADGGGIFEFSGEVQVANTGIVTNNTVGGNVNNCRPANSVPNCIG